MLCVHLHDILQLRAQEKQSVNIYVLCLNSYLILTCHVYKQY